MKYKIITILMVLLLSIFIIGCNSEEPYAEGQPLEEGDLDVTPENLDTYVDLFDEWEYSELSDGIEQDTVGSITLLSFSTIYDTDGATYEEVEEILEGYFTDWELMEPISELTSEHAHSYRKDFEDEGYAIVYGTYHVESASNLFVSVEFRSL